MEKDAECPVCYENLSRKIQTRFPCTHTMCLICLAKMKRPPKCPMCRFDLKEFLPQDSLQTLTEPLTPPRRRATLSFMIQRQGSDMLPPQMNLSTSETFPPPLMQEAVSDNVDEASPTGRITRRESMMFEMTPPLTTDDPSVIGTLRARVVQPGDLLNARVTRNSIFLRGQDLS